MSPALLFPERNVGLQYRCNSEPQRNTVNLFRGITWLLLFYLLSIFPRTFTAHSLAESNTG